MSEILAIDPDTWQTWRARLADPAYAPAVKAALKALGSPRAEARLAPRRAMSGQVAVIRLHGFMTQRPTLFSMLFGGTSTERFAAEVVEALQARDVRAVVADVDSPGGSVHGLEEAASAIRAAAGSKPFISISNSLMGSAAYWIASQADSVIASPSSLTGSIGALVEHVDLSEALAKEGVKVTVIRYGEHKGEGHPSQPLSEAALSHVQATVNRFGQQFEADVARGRRISISTVRNNYGQGRTFPAQAALSRGLVDEIASMADVLGAVATGRRVEGEAHALKMELIALECGLPPMDAAKDGRQSASLAREIEAAEALL